VDKSGRDIRINTFVNKDIICDQLFGYISGVLRRIYNNLQMPEYFVLNETQAVRHHMKNFDYQFYIPVFIWILQYEEPTIKD